MSNVFVQLRDGTTVRLRQQDAKAIIAVGMVLPKYSTIKNKEIAECEFMFDYSVSLDHRAADMGTALEKMSTSADLLALGVREITHSIVSVISQNPEYFCSTTVGGFVFQSTGKPFLFLKNATVFSEPSQAALDNTRICFIDLTEVRRQAIHQYELEKNGQSFLKWAMLSGVVSFFTALFGYGLSAVVPVLWAKMGFSQS